MRRNARAVATSSVGQVSELAARPRRRTSPRPRDLQVKLKVELAPHADGEPLVESAGHVAAAVDLADRSRPRVVLADGEARARADSEASRGLEIRSRL